ncbi:MAG TPA: FAD-dependent monooxygenase [Luteibacter sp.]|jgi:2-polyprenyl-6-methoxyphenol hydroxylase-like FAD-dependent oxidoreductase|uniref:FAD-dependent monooxygenase n=1 Tax=Luteibacter sp. TaxID=1886636 RepID=UPI002F428913
MDDVLITGAGPTGLVLALWLTAQGVKVRIIDKKEGPGDTSRAMVVQARTLELYRQLGLAEPVLAAGNRMVAINMWTRGKHAARLPLQDAGAGISPYPAPLIYPQDHHERVLGERLEAMGVTVERSTELVSLEQGADSVTARLRRADGGEETTTARYLAGCDGARSAVREALGIGFEGGTYRSVFYVADVKLSGMESPDEGHVSLEQGDFVLLLPYGKDGRARLIGTVDDERADSAEALTFEDVRQDSINRLKVTIDEVTWFSTYRVHHRVADTFRRDRVFLLGDAGHVHSPAGGQGMNTGILDAINLAWKLAAVLRGEAPDPLLDTYNTERQGFAHQLVNSTDRGFSLMTSGGGLANFLRVYVMPYAAHAVFELAAARRAMFKLVSQTELAYHGSALSEGEAGKVKGGDRLPWVRIGDKDNYEPLAHIGWQVHVYGEPRPELMAWCLHRGVALRDFAWDPAYEKAGLAEGAAYLLRPDTWVALAAPEGTVEALEAYFSSHGLTAGGAKAEGAMR